MTGLDLFVYACWLALGLLVLTLPACFLIYMVRRMWAAAGEQVWKDRMEKLAASR